LAAADHDRQLQHIRNPTFRRGRQNPRHKGESVTVSLRGVIAISTIDLVAKT